MTKITKITFVCVRACVCVCACKVGKRSVSLNNSENISFIIKFY